MGFTVVVFKEFKVKPVRLPDGSNEMHVIPLDMELANVPHIAHLIFEKVLAERYPGAKLCVHKCYVDDLTVNDIKDPSWYLKFFNEDFRNWIREHGAELHEKVRYYVPKDTLFEVETADGWVEAWCRSILWLQESYFLGRQVVYTECVVRDALDWWLEEEAMRLNMDAVDLWRVKAKDPEFEEWWGETKDKIWSEKNVRPWLLSLKEAGIEIPEKFKGMVRGEGFAFSVEETLEELEANPKWRNKVDAYRMHQRGMFQDEIKKHFGVTQSAVSKWINQVKGELSRRMGAAYELYRKKKLELREDVERVVHDGREGRPDFTVYLKDGSIEVISSKCYFSDRKSVSMKIEEIKPELEEARELRKQGRKVKLLVDFYNVATEKHEFREVNIDGPPARLLFTNKMNL